jgi:ribokinase
MIVVAGGANLALESVGEAICDVFLTQLETPVPVIAAFLSGMRPSITILNAAPAVVGGEVLFPSFDIVIVNETELARYAGATAAPTALDEIAILARRLISRPDQSLVVTLGAAGAAAVSTETAFLVPGRPARSIDTTGAGDCFCGVLAAALDEGVTLAEAMALANAAAALSTQTHGAGVSMPTRSATAAFASAKAPD